MPKHRQQHCGWQPGQQVFQPLPSDLQTINAMVMAIGSRPSNLPQAALENCARRVANEAIGRMLVNGRIS